MNKNQLPDRYSVFSTINTFKDIAFVYPGIPVIVEKVCNLPRKLVSVTYDLQHAPAARRSYTRGK